MTTSATPHLFWITSRAAGIVALVLASLAVSLGLLMSTKLLRRRGPDLLATHEVLSLSAMVAIVVHGVTLIGDKYLHPSLIDVAVPFVGSYKTFWTSIGIISGWGLILLGLSYYARRRIGAARWRKLHRFTALVWLLGIGHALGEGTDAGQIWFLVMIGLVAGPALLLLATRWLRVGTPAPIGSVDRGDVRTVHTGAVATDGVVVRDPVEALPVAAGEPVAAGSRPVHGNERSRPIAGGTPSSRRRIRKTPHDRPSLPALKGAEAGNHSQ